MANESRADGADGTTQTSEAPWRRRSAAPAESALHLVIVWASTPQRVGEVVALSKPALLGRGPARSEDPAPRLRFIRQRPGANHPAPMLEPSRLSRVQLVFTPECEDAVRFERLGQCSVRHNGALSDKGLAREGDVLALSDAVTFLLERRPKVMPESWAVAPYGSTRFGQPDPFGMVGESLYAWELRRQIATLACGTDPILITGASGVGKELVARALHGMSEAAGGKLVARNAATLPPLLLDAELFGTQRNYPNPGTPERPGLVGEADGGTLFLDEIGELALEQQGHLLRFLDRGEYQRLGDAKVRHAKVRVVAATNRDPGALKHDFLARFAKRIDVQGIEVRFADMPLLVSEIVRDAARRVPDYGRFLESAVEPDGSETLHARVHPQLMDRLLCQDYTLHFRELRRLVTLALESSDGTHLTSTAAVERELKPLPMDCELEASDIEQALAACGGSVAQAARALRLPSRYALYRLMKRFGLVSGAG